MNDNIEVLLVSSANLGQTCIQVFNLSSGKSCIKSYRGICAAPNTLCSIGSHDYIICGQKDRPLLQAWSLNQTDCLQMRFPVPGRVNTMSVSHSEDRYCAIGIGEKIYIYQLNTGLQIGIIERHYQDVKCLQFTPCGNYLASAGDDGLVYLWSKLSLIESLHKIDKPQIQPHYILGQHSDKVTDMCITEAGMRGMLVSCSQDHSAKVFDLVTGHLRQNIIGSSGLTACVCNALGSQLFFANAKGRVWGINLLPFSSRTDLELEGNGIECHGSAITHLSMTTSGDILITGGVDGEVKLWTVVMTERKNFGAPSLAPQGSLWSGRGAISNLLVMNLSSDVFNLCTMQSRVVFSPFTKESTGEGCSPLSVSVLHPLPENTDVTFDNSRLLSLASDLLSGNYEKSAKRERKTKKVSSNSLLMERTGMSDGDFLFYVQKLQEKNEDLYKFCLKHLIGED